MITTENLTALTEYLEENQHRNRTVDKARLTKLRKLGASFDPLLDRSDTDITATSPFEELKKLLPNAHIEFDPGMNPAESALLARRSDIVIVFGIRVEGESFDLPNLSLP